MLIKIFPTGQGNGYWPVEYLCSTNPFGKGARGHAPRVMSGNPSIIMRQIDAVPFKHKYTSGVHSFAQEDNPTDEQIREVMDETENLAFAGLPLSSRSILWVKHEHAGRTELHFLIPRQEVNTGKAFNAFPPGWQQKYDPLRDKFNYKYGWARPDDPERARHWQPGINTKILEDARRKNEPNPKSEVFALTDELGNMALQGKLANRMEIVSELRRRGYGISRQGKNYITIVDNNSGKRTRLKGTLFEENFNGPEWIKSANANFNKPASEKSLVDLDLAAKADADLREAIQKTALYNIERYGLKEIQNGESTEKSPARPKAAFEPGREEEKMGLGIKNSQRTVTAIKKSPDRKKDDSNALYPEQGLGESGAIERHREAGNHVQVIVREIPLPEQSFSGMGGGTGERSPLEKRNRDTAEQLPRGSNPDFNNSIGTGPGNIGRQPGKPGGYDEVDHGYPERIARKSGRFGEYYWLSESLRKGTEKLANRILALGRGKGITEPTALFTLDVALDNFSNAASSSIMALGALHENNLLKILAVSIADYQTSQDGLFEKSGYKEKLAGLAQIAQISMTRLGNLHEQNLARNIVKCLSTFNPGNARELGIAAENAAQNISRLAEFNLIQKIAKITAPIALDSADKLALKAENFCSSLRNVNAHNLEQKLKNIVPNLAVPDFSGLLRMAHDLQSALKQVFEAKALTAIAHAEQKRQKVIDDFMRHAEWAGSNLKKWHHLAREYKKRPYHFKLVKTLLAIAQQEFLIILKQTNKLDEIKNLCGENPLLLREFGILCRDITKCYEERENLHSDNTLKEDADLIMKKHCYNNFPKP